MGTASPTNIAAGAVVALAALFSGPAMAEPADVEVIKDRLQQYEARFNKGDAEALARLFSENVVYYDPTGRVHEGRAAVEQLYSNNMKAGFSDMAVEVIEVRVAGDRAYDIARYTITSPAGDPLSGYHLAILEKQDGEWTVRRTLVNAVMPAPPGK